MGAKLQPGSGNQWHSKLDVKDTGFLWSLKRTTYNSFSITLDMIGEMVHAVYAPGGVGGNNVPAMCISLNDKEDIVVMRLSDFVGIIERDLVSKRSDAIKRSATTKFSRNKGDTDGSQET